MARGAFADVLDRIRNVGQWETDPAPVCNIVQKQGQCDKLVNSTMEALVERLVTSMDEISERNRNEAHTEKRNSTSRALPDRCWLCVELLRGLYNRRSCLPTVPEGVIGQRYGW